MSVTVVSTSPYLALFDNAGSYPRGVIINVQPVDWVGTYGSTVTFSVDPYSGDGSILVYQWQEFTTQWDNLVDGIRISGAITKVLSISNAQAIDDGRQFRVSITNDFGTTISETVIIIGSA